MRKISAIALTASFFLGCGIGPISADLRRVRLNPGYRTEQHERDLKIVRDSRWPDRMLNSAPWYLERSAAHYRLFAETDFLGVSREAVLGMLGAEDGDLRYREAEVTMVGHMGGNEIEIKTPDEVPYLVPSEDDRLIYRFGDGYNHNIIYALLLKDGRVSEVVISAGY